MITQAPNKATILSHWDSKSDRKILNDWEFKPGTCELCENSHAINKILINPSFCFLFKETLENLNTNCNNIINNILIKNINNILIKINNIKNINIILIIS